MRKKNKMTSKWRMILKEKQEKSRMRKINQMKTKCLRNFQMSKMMSIKTFGMEIRKKSKKKKTRIKIKMMKI